MANKYATTAAATQANERKFKDNTHKLYDRRKLWQERKAARNATKKQVWIPGIGTPNDEIYVAGYWERV